MVGATLWAHAGPGGEPPPLTPLRLLTGWHLEPVPAVGVLVLAGLYLYGVHRLRSRGDAWSSWRSVMFVGLGLGSFVLATQSALAAYDTVLFSVHMVQHMILGMVAPIFLALGAPVTLALRVLPTRSMARQRLLAVLHSRVVRILSFPLIPFLIFVASPFALYLTGWYPATLDNPWLHEAMHVHFLLAGSLFFWPLIGLDPVPGRVPHPMRMLILVGTLPLHAVLGLTIMNDATLIAGAHYLALDLAWSSPVSEQRVAGGLLWASGDIVGLFMIGVAAYQWMKASEREAVREDRRLDRLDRLEQSPGLG